MDKIVSLEREAGLVVIKIATLGGEVLAVSVVEAASAHDARVVAEVEALVSAVGS